MTLIVNGVEIETVYFNGVEIETLEHNGNVVFQKNTGPTPLASDGGVDWYGEVPASELITGDALASLVGLTVGTSQNSNEPWLHVGLDGTELLIAKKPFRHTINWDSLNAINIVYGNRIININNQDYKIRLIKGANADPIANVSGFDHVNSHGSEWNRIFYRLTEDVYSLFLNTKVSENPFTHLALYSENDLYLYANGLKGTHTWCQETAASGRGVFRGWLGISYLYANPKSIANSDYGWRPVLEKV